MPTYAVIRLTNCQARYTKFMLYVIQVEVFSPHRAQLYSDQLIVDGSLILKDMRLDQDQQHIFLLTRTNVRLLDITFRIA